MADGFVAGDDVVLGGLVLMYGWLTLKRRLSSKGLSPIIDLTRGLSQVYHPTMIIIALLATFKNVIVVLLYEPLLFLKQVVILLSEVFDSYLSIVVCPYLVCLLFS